VVNEPDLVPVVAKLRAQYGTAFQVLVHTQDWHPRDHISFATQHPGVPVLTTIDLPRWTQLVVPEHCVQGTTGAEIHEALLPLPVGTHLIRKGGDARVESHSAFYDVLGGCTGLLPLLRAEQVERLWICGVHTDVLVLKTVLDALRIFPDPGAVAAVTDAVRGFVPARFEQSFEQMRAAGARLVTLGDL